MKTPFRALLIVFFCLIVTGMPADAQENATGPTVFKASPRAASATLLKQGKALIHLWGIEEISNAAPAFNLKARTMLENAIAGKSLECELKDKDSEKIYALCTNASNLDLGLYMIQQGFAVVDRSVIYGTAFEDIYIKEELSAQNRGAGIWSENERSPGSSGGAGNNDLIANMGLIIFAIVMLSFGVLSVMIMRGFQKVISAQNDNMNMMSRERKIRDKERSIVTSMLDSELKANKSKIDAYMVVYEETLSDLKNPNKAPRYQKLGDIVQKQPGLSRAVFEKNTDKLDILGKKLASELIHFYARIKTNPDYETIEPDTDVNIVITMVEESLDHARRLGALCQYLLDTFEEGNFDYNDDDMEEAAANTETA